MDNGASSYRRFLDGDENGFVDIVRDYKDGLILFLNSFVNDIYVAEELCEDTFVRIGIKKPHFLGKSSFKTWIYAIGRNVALDYLRKKSRYETVSVDENTVISDTQSLESLYIKEERKRTVLRAVKNLKREYGQVLWLSYFEGLSAKETAKIMKKSTHSIETLTYRAKKSLKQELIKEGFNFEDL